MKRGKKEEKKNHRNKIVPVMYIDLYNLNVYKLQAKAKQS